ncbi:hypothetical protein HK407_01g01920 [Ordospora pajunii]|uniref:uncharacterized protein n=1 Tax=Ordospora pajunii TaxID=3039483 RepID=UPI0029528BC5|nr:uncharacterized protein HK407_01g01920 [Ordospora pajunii]KAH9412297.1 hypothetical protein HK407_01g01920 [Ordospora pajunii]
MSQNVSESINFRYCVFAVMRGTFVVPILLSQMMCKVYDTGYSSFEPVVDEAALNNVGIPFLTGPSQSGINMLKDPMMVDIYGSYDKYGGYPPSAGMNAVNPIANMEGVFFDNLYKSMAPIIAHFSDKIGQFRTWYQSVEVIMSSDMRREIVSSMYAIHHKENDNELEEFWAMILGQLLLNTMPSLNEDFNKLKLMVNVERAEGNDDKYEFNELLKAQTENDVEYVKESGLVMTNLELGISKYGMKIFTDVVEPFLNSAVDFKRLKRRMENMVGTSKSLIIN